MDEQTLRDAAASLPPIAAMASPDVQRILAIEEGLVRAANRQAPTVEDLVHAIALDPVGETILRSCGATVDVLVLALAAAANRVPSSAPEHERVLQIAKILTKDARREHVGLAMLLRVLFLVARKVARREALGETGCDVARRAAIPRAPNSQASSPLVGAVCTRGSISVARASRYKVVFVNDEFTTREFVCGLLESVFDYPREQAERITGVVHDEGRCAVGDYPAWRARWLAARATRRAVKKGHPLLVILEPCESV